MRYLHVAGNCYWRVWGFYKMKRTLLLAASAAVLAAPTIAQELPPGNPLPGECFARVIVPATYETSTEQVVLRQAGEEIVKIPGRFETVTERVLVQEASTELVIAGSGAGGGTFRANGKSYSVSGDGSVYSYGSGSGAGAGGAGGTLVGRIENGNFVGTNGSIIARNVSVNYTTSGSRSGQPSFRTVTETVVVQEASTELVSIPPVYDTVTETVVVQPESVEYVTVPAVYENYTCLLYTSPSPRDRG